ncbi:MAG: XdhC family protein [Hyphomicrobium sp.]|nr:XdhC family protein [Hyphomicrobium sp.]
MAEAISRALLIDAPHELAAPERPSLIAHDDAFGDYVAWRLAGQRAVLVTLVGIDGATPRPLGAHMAISETGETSGYLSGGCLEQTVAAEAQSVLRDGANRLVRYGKGSVYFDVSLPCDSGLDLYFDQDLPMHLVRDAARARSAREPVILETDFERHTSNLAAVTPSEPTRSHVRGSVMRTVMLPAPRVLIVGGGPAIGAIAQVLAATGFELDIVTPDDSVRADVVRAGLEARGLVDEKAFDPGPLDRWSAAVVAFHEHAWEAPILARILEAPCFYIGVMGSRTAQEGRLARLADLGVPAEQRARLKGPIGLIPGAKSRLTLAVGIAAEIVAAAKAQGMVA